MPPEKLSSQELVALQKDVTREAMDEEAPAIQRKLVDTTVNAAVDTTVENMIHRREDTFKNLKTRGLIKDDIDKETFKTIKQEAGNNPSARLEAYLSHDILTRSSDLATKRDLDQFDKEREHYTDAVSKYDKSMENYNREVMAHLTTQQQQREAYREYESDLNTSSDYPKEPQFPTDKEGNALKKPIDPRVEKVNAISDIELINSGMKGQEREDDKITRKLNGDHTKLTDKTRVTVLTDSKKTDDRFVENFGKELDKLTPNTPMSDTTYMRKSGYNFRKLLAKLGNATSEVQITNKEMKIANNATHPLHRATRALHDNNGEYIGDTINESTRNKIKALYNTAMKEVEENHENTQLLFKQGADGKYQDFSFSKRNDIEDFKGEELKERYQEMERLKQSMHVSAALFSSPDFREQYFDGLKDLNKERERFPTDLIPKDELITSADTEKILEALNDGTLTEEKTAKTRIAQSRNSDKGRG